jgi:C4-dicarboxylate-specific signal transduction histidine kinase
MLMPPDTNGGTSVIGPPEPGALVRFGVAVCSVLVALAATLAFRGLVDPSLPFLAAVIVTSWIGGMLAGLSAVLLSSLAMAYRLPPADSFAVDAAELPYLLFFGLAAVFIGWLSAQRKKAVAALKEARGQLELRVRERTSELKDANEQLLAEMAERRRAAEAYSKARAELARASRLTTMGELAASISHEVNQPLAAVVTNADACVLWLAGDKPNLDEARAAADRIVREGARASEVLRRVRAMFSNAEPKRERIDVNGLVRETVALMQGEAQRNHVDVRTGLTPDLPAAIGDRVQLQQVIVNLVTNGIEAMNGTAASARELVITSARQDPNQVLVAVQDSGKGIRPEDRKRIFDAFYTTKEDGMGMGLSISRSIIEAHGGTLWAAPNGGPGATVSFSIPVCEEDGR